MNIIDYPATGKTAYMPNKAELKVSKEEYVAWQKALDILETAVVETNKTVRLAYDINDWAAEFLRSAYWHLIHTRVSTSQMLWQILDTEEQIAIVEAAEKGEGKEMENETN